MADELPFGSTRAKRLEERAEKLGTADLTTDDGVDAPPGAARALERAEARDPALGGSVYEFSSLPGRALRLHYVDPAFRLDPDGDARLANLHQTPFATSDIVELERLSARPYYLCKVDVDLQRESPESDLLVLNYKRPAAFANVDAHDRESPFEPGSDELVVLFSEHSVLPRLRGRIVDFRQATGYAAASGVLWFRVDRSGERAGGPRI